MVINNNQAIEYQLKYCAFHELSNLELYDVLKLRTDVFVVEQNCPYPELDNLDQEAMHLLLSDKVGERLGAYLRVFYPKKQLLHARIGRVVVSEEYRKKGYGKMIMQQAIDIIQEKHPQSPIKIAAQTYLLAFYQSFGFKALGNTYIEDGIEHVDMLLQ